MYVVEDHMAIGPRDKCLLAELFFLFFFPPLLSLPFLSLSVRVKGKGEEQQKEQVVYPGFQIPFALHSSRQNASRQRFPLAASLSRPPFLLLLFLLVSLPGLASCASFSFELGIWFALAWGRLRGLCVYFSFLLVLWLGNTGGGSLNERGRPVAPPSQSVSDQHRAPKRKSPRQPFLQNSRRSLPFS